jgi:hypothetical protein
MLDNSTTPSDTFLQLGQHPAIIVVQNIANVQAPLPQGTRVVVRMVNGTAVEVLNASILPATVGGINVERALSAGPMPVPLAYQLSLPPAPVSLEPCGYAEPCWRPSYTVSNWD